MNLLRLGRRTAFIPFAFVGLLLAAFTLHRPADAPTPPAVDDVPTAQIVQADVSSWAVDKAHSQVGFKVRHLGISNVRGAFRLYDADLRFDPDDLSTLQASATVDVASIDTENEKRDDHLRSADFFDAANHPTMTFESTGVRNVRGNRFELIGDLTIRGVTQQVVLDGQLVGVAQMRGNDVAALEASTTIDRLEYGLAWNNLTETGGLIVAHDVDIILEIEAAKE